LLVAVTQDMLAIETFSLGSTVCLLHVEHSSLCFWDCPTPNYVAVSTD